MRTHGTRLLVLAVLALGVYWNTFDSPFLFDDLTSVLGNPLIRISEFDLGRLYLAATESWPEKRPVAHLSFALNYYFGGYDVTGYHLVNTLAHIATTFLVYALALGLFRELEALPNERWRLAPERAGGLALAAAALFAAHPIQIQTVTYLYQRSNGFAVMFYLAAFLLYVRGRKSGTPSIRWSLWICGALSWLLALGSKQLAITLPAAILLYEYYFPRDLDTDWLRANALRIALAGAGVAAAILLIFGFDHVVDAVFSMYDEKDFTLGERLLTQLRVVALYASLLVLPLPSRLNVIHDMPLSQSLFDPISTLTSMLFLLGLAAIGLWSMRRARLVSFCIAWFFLHLALESSFLALDLIYEHRLYLPMCAVVLLPAWALGTIPLSERNATTVALIAVLLLATASVSRNRIWQDHGRLWNDVLAKNPNSAVAQHNIGYQAATQGRFVEAEAHFREAVRIQPRDLRARKDLGLALSAQGKHYEAIEFLSEVVRMKPDYADGHLGLGRAWFDTGRLGDAEKSLRRALELDPANPVTHEHLGATLGGLGKTAEAIAMMERALEIDPLYTPAREGLRALKAGRGRAVPQR